MSIKNRNIRQYAVIGLGRFGTAITKALYGAGKDVLAIDVSEEKTLSVREYSTHAVTADASEPNVLKELGIHNFDVVIVAVSQNMQANILITMMCRELGVKYIIAKAQNRIHKTVLEKIGADMVIIPEEDMAAKLATTLLNPALGDLMELADNYCIAETGIPKSWNGMALKDLNIRSRFKINLLMIKRGQEVLSPPAGDTVLMTEDILISGGKNEDIIKFSEKISHLSKDD